MIRVAVNGYGTMVPTTFMHMHAVIMHLDNEAKKARIVEIIENHSRMGLVRNVTGISSTAELMEYMRDLGRPRADLWENGIFEDSISVEGKNLCLFQAVHQEAIVVVETIDAIRAAAGIIRDPEASIRKTNDTMGVVAIG